MVASAMLLHYLAVGYAIRLPAARPHAVVPRAASVTMNSYLESTIGQRGPTYEPPSPEEPQAPVQNEMNSMQGAVVPTQPGFGTGDEQVRAQLAQLEMQKPNMSEDEYFSQLQAILESPATQALTPPPAYAAPMMPAPVPAYQETGLVSSRTARVLGPISLAAGAIAGTLAVQSMTAPKPITVEEIQTAQREWADAIVKISNAYLANGDYVSAAAKAADDLYGYGRTDVLFKPTKASQTPFRPTAEGALSYFVGGDKVDGGYAEDGGFALNYGKGWKKVIFDNNKIDYNGATATAMGEYYFYSALDDSVAKVEYTFGYKRNEDGKVRIYLHHSSLPYTKKKAPPAPITMDEIVQVQREWADAIVKISNAYLANGDYVSAAAKAADDLYGYGRTDVLFKPTKASQTPFRPTAEGALSYFVGGDKVDGGYAEDGGFALNYGKGWKKVIFDNNKIDYNGATATAMGEYYFYSALDDSVAKVEYTFGYKRNEDGKVRIYLHHSSLPYPGKKPAPPPAEAPKA